MPSVFPTLLSWQELAPTIIRLTLAAVLIYWTFSTFRNSTNPTQKIVSLGEGFVAILLIIGLYVQAAALALIIDLSVRLVQKITSRQFLTNGVNYYLILLVLSFTLLITGAGLFAFDVAL